MRTGFALPQSRCPQHRHVRPFLLCHPLSSLLGDLGETLGSPGLFPCFSAFLGHGGPLDAPQAFCAPGSGPSRVVGASEGEEADGIFLHPIPPPQAPHQHLPGPGPAGPPCLVPSPRLHKRRQLPAPPSGVLPAPGLTGPLPGAGAGCAGRAPGASECASVCACRRACVSVCLRTACRRAGSPMQPDLGVRHRRCSFHTVCLSPT